MTERPEAGSRLANIDAAVKAAWKETKPSHDAQSIRASLSMLSDELEDWLNDENGGAYNFVLNLLDIAAQKGMERAQRPEAGSRLEALEAVAAAARHLCSRGLTSGEVLAAHDAALVALAELDAASPDDDWQPIETIPEGEPGDDA